MDVKSKQLELTIQLKPATVKIDEEIALKWLQNGAKPSDTVRNLFSKQGIMEKFHNAKLGK